MVITEVQNNNYLILKLQGSLDIYTSLDLKNHIEKIQKPPEILIFDLNGIDYVDSSGIGTLIKIINFLKEKQTGFFVTGIKSSIEKIFVVAGLMPYFTVLSEKEFKVKYPF